MKNQELFEVFCKALGLYFAMQAFINIKDTIIYGMQLQNGDDWVYIFFVGQTLSFLFNGIASLILINKSAFIATKIFKESGNNLEIVINKIELIELVIITISGVLIINSIPNLLAHIINFIYFNPFDRMEKSEFWTNKNTSDLIYSTFKLTVGLLTITNARLISRRLTKIGDKSDQLGGN